MTDYKDEIRERAGLGSSGYLYRGAGVEETENILDRRALTGKDYPVWWVDNSPEEIDDARALGIEGALDVAYREDVPITGGLSSSLGGAQKFSQSLSEVGVVLVFDPEKVDPTPEPITYDLEWFDAHAGLLARVASLVDGEVRTADDGSLYGLVREDGVIDSTGRENLSLKTQTPMYSDEQEFYVPGKTLNLSGAVVGAVSVLHTQRAVGGSIQGALVEYPGYMRGRVGSDSKNVNNMSNEEMAADFHGIIEDTAGLSPEIDTPYYVLLMDDDRWKKGAGVDEDEFLLAYDGSNSITRRGVLPRWLPV
jgi:hypothetical protein